MRRAGALLATALGLAACQPQAGHGPYAFAVDVDLTPAAAQKLSALHEKVAVAAYYSGLPAQGVQAGQDGQVDLGSDKQEFAPPQSEARFSGTVVAESDLKTISGKPRVLINVFSARHASPDNLLDCGIFDGEIAAAQAKTPRITCDLLNP